MSTEVSAERRPARPSLRGLFLVAGIGACVGGAIGTTLLAGLLSRGFTRLLLVDVQLGLVFGGISGALAGAILAPLLGWFVLRPVPLGRALLFTGAGTVTCALAVAPFMGPIAPVWAGIAGLVLGAVGARLTTRRPSGPHETP